MKNKIILLAKYAYRALIELFFIAFDSFLLLFLGKSSYEKDRVAIVKLDHIGDYLLWVGHISNIRKLYPLHQYHLTLICNQAVLKIAKLNCEIDDVMPLDVNRLIASLFYRISVAKKVHEKAFFVAINPTFSREIFRSDAVVRFTGAKLKIGFRGDATNISPAIKRIADSFYTDLRVIPSNLRNELEINAEFLKNNTEVAIPKLADLSSIAMELPRNLIKKKYFILVPGGSWTGKRWPAESFAKIADKIHAKYGIFGVVCGSSSEKGLAREIQKFTKHEILDLTGETNILGLINLIKFAKVLVTNDTSAAHIGPAVGSPTVCIVGGGHFGRFLPYPKLNVMPPLKIANIEMDCYGCNWNCIFKRTKGRALPCIERISVDQVWLDVQELLNITH